MEGQDLIASSYNCTSDNGGVMLLNRLVLTQVVSGHLYSSFSQNEYSYLHNEGEETQV